ncbi:MAG: glycosyltransferase family 4 protein [Planctomycetota bacterium]
MKVLIVNDLATDTGGAERVSLLMRERLRARGVDARLFASVASPLPGVEHQADDACFGTNAAWRPALATVNPFAMARLRSVLRRFRPDVVHLRMFMWQLSPIILRELRNTPTLVHVVNYDLICPMNTKTLPTGEPCSHRPGLICLKSRCLGPAGLARGVTQRAILRRYFDSACDRLIVNSHWVRGRLEAEGVRVDGVVWNGVRTVDQRPPLSTGPTVCFAGRLVAKKGADTLVEAMALVRKRIPEARLLIAGDGPLRAELARRSGELGLGESVRFLGHLGHDAMHEAFAGAWVQAAPSRWEEPFGLVAAEAMMRGTAAIVSDTGGLSEQVLDGVTGYHVRPRDTAAWAEQITRVLSDKQHAEALGAAGRDRALSEFTIDAMVERTIEQYHITAAR